MGPRARWLALRRRSVHPAGEARGDRRRRRRRVARIGGDLRRPDGRRRERLPSRESRRRRIRFTRTGSQWTQSARLTASHGQNYDSFATSVAISGKTIVVGAPETTVGGTYAAQGAAYVFVKGPSGWSQTSELTASDGKANDVLGSSVAISGTTIVAGAPTTPSTLFGDSGAGAAYVLTNAVSG